MIPACRKFKIYFWLNIVDQLFTSTFFFLNTIEMSQRDP